MEINDVPPSSRDGCSFPANSVSWERGKVIKFITIYKKRIILCKHNVLLYFYSHFIVLLFEKGSKHFHSSFNPIFPDVYSFFLFYLKIMEGQKDYC